MTYLEQLLAMGAPGLQVPMSPMSPTGLAGAPPSQAAAPRGGLGSVWQDFTERLLPVPKEVADSIDPQTLKAMRQQALLQMGLGMMAASNKGAGLGAGLQYGYNAAQEGLNSGLGRAYTAMRNTRADQALTEAQKRTDQREERYLNAAEAQAKRQAEQDARQAARDKVSDEWRQKQYDLQVAQLRSAAGDRAIDNARLQAEADARAEERATRRKASEQELKDRTAVIASGTAIGKYEAAMSAQGVTPSDAWRPAPGKPTYGEIKATYQTFTGRPWREVSALEQAMQSAMAGAPPQPGAPAAPQGTAPQAAVDALRKDPSLAPQFKAKYGYLPPGM